MVGVQTVPLNQFYSAVVSYCIINTTCSTSRVRPHRKLLYLFALLTTITDDYFVPAVEYFAAFLKLSENIAGITFVALGNGAPDIFGAMAAFTSATPETSSLAIGALLGAGAFIR